MKITSHYFIVLSAACMAAGCSSGPGNDVVEDASVQDLCGGDSLMDVAGEDTAVADEGMVDAGNIDVVPPQDTVSSDLVPNDVFDDVAPVDVPADVEQADSVIDAVEPLDIALNPRVSACGGFTAVPRAAEDSYCGDDRLVWLVDSENDVIHFTNEDVFLNCCGIHSVTVTIQDGVYVITEIDEPEDGGARCDCMCLFDFAVDMPLIDENPIQVRIDRLVTDAGDTPSTAWDGEIDLTAGSGDILIDDLVGWCTEAVNIGQNSQFSACGGFQAEIPRLLELPPIETLNWDFDAETGVVSFVDSDMCLNCCGSHSMSLFLIDDVYVLAEVDDPADGSGRCFCNCIFDYSIELPGMTASVIDVRVTRDVTDSGLGAVDVWAGSIDLSAGSGSIELQAEAATCI